MKRLIFTSFWLAMVFYLLITVIYGNSGILASGDAQRILAKMELNIEELQAKNDTYKSQWALIQEYPEFIAREGRSLGYLASDEVVLSLRTPPPVPRVVPSAGSLIFFNTPVASFEKKSKILALILGFISLTLGGVAFLLKRSKAMRRSARPSRFQKLTRRAQDQALSS